MNCCGHCQDAEDFFNEKTAKKDLRRYHRRGPDKSTLLLLNAIRKEDIEDSSLLDIGGGIGAIQLEFFKKGLNRSVNVDASKAYQNISRQEAARLGYSEKTEYIFGDFTELSSGVPSADIVTLDRVLCCYPDVDKLLDASLQKAGRIYGVVFPRENWFMRIGIRLGNLWFKIRKSEFRTYLHPHQKIEKKIHGYGFHPDSSKQTFMWKVMTFTKA
jgi:hypothetical protein